MHRRLIWSDEFDGPAGTPPDRSFWRHEVGGGGWGNGELQRYTGDAANASLDGNGRLAIRALREGDGFTSARLVTKGRYAFRYGRAEARIRVPRGAGVWSAFWMLGQDIDATGWPGCGEIDVMENVGSDPGRVFGTVHCPGHSGADGISGGIGGVTSGFHDYAVDWSRDRIGWSLDGREYHAVTRAGLGEAWVFDHEFYLLLNLAVGGTLGGPVDLRTAFPAVMEIDHIRVYAPQEPMVDSAGGDGSQPS